MNQPTIYQVATQADYDALMEEIHIDMADNPPREVNLWQFFKEESCIWIKYGYLIQWDSKDNVLKNYPNAPIIEYKAPRMEEVE